MKSLAAFGFEHPGPEGERRRMPHVLAVSARQLRHPVALLVLVPAYDRLIHSGQCTCPMPAASTVSCGYRHHFNRRPHPRPQLKRARALVHQHPQPTDRLRALLCCQRRGTPSRDGRSGRMRPVPDETGRPDAMARNRPSCRPRLVAFTTSSASAAASPNCAGNKATESRISELGSVALIAPHSSSAFVTVSRTYGHVGARLAQRVHERARRPARADHEGAFRQSRRRVRPGRARTHNRPSYRPTTGRPP